LFKIFLNYVKSIKKIHKKNLFFFHNPNAEKAQILGILKRF
jgi:hypothetical protein